MLDILWKIFAIKINIWVFSFKAFNFFSYYTLDSKRAWAYGKVSITSVMIYLMLDIWYKIIWFELKFMHNCHLEHSDKNLQSKSTSHQYCVLQNDGQFRKRVIQSEPKSSNESGISTSWPIQIGIRKAQRPQPLPMSTCQIRPPIIKKQFFK